MLNEFELKEMVNKLGVFGISLTGFSIPHTHHMYFELLPIYEDENVLDYYEIIRQILHQYNLAVVTISQNLEDEDDYLFEVLAMLTVSVN